MSRNPGNDVFLKIVAGMFGFWVGIMLIGSLVQLLPP